MGNTLKAKAGAEIVTPIRFSVVIWPIQAVKAGK
jgi:hypothetical protein